MVARKRVQGICRGQASLHDRTWSVAELEDTIVLMGEDYWPYGVRPNLQTIETFVRYHHVQGLSQEPLSPKDLFVSETLELV